MIKKSELIRELKALRDYARTQVEYAYIPVRLNYLDGEWELYYGNPSDDPNHRGQWSYGQLSTTDKTLSTLADRLIGGIEPNQDNYSIDRESVYSVYVHRVDIYQRLNLYHGDRTVMTLEGKQLQGLIDTGIINPTDWLNTAIAVAIG